MLPVTAAIGAIPSAAPAQQNWALTGDSRGRHLVRDAEDLCTTCARLEELAELHHEARLNEVEVRQVPYNLTDHHRGLHGRRTDA